MLCFAFSQSDFAFDSTVLPVQVERHQGESTLFDLANQSPNLIFLQQQFLVRALSEGTCVEALISGLIKHPMMNNSPSRMTT